MKKASSSVSTGILDMIVAACSFGTMTAFVKLATQTLPAFEVVFFRSLAGVAMISAVMWKEKVSFVGKSPKLFALRGLCGFLALVMHFYAISRLNLGTAVILGGTAPIFVAIYAATLLKEKMRGSLWAFTLLCFSGLYLLAAPELSREPLALAAGLFSGVMAAGAFVAIRYVRRSESSYTIIFYFTAISTICSLPLLRFGFVMPQRIAWVWIAGIAVASFFGQVFITKSLREAPASVVSPFSYLAPVCAFVYGYLIWGDPFTWRTVLGAGLIIASGCMIYLVERKPIPISE
jgi:drug/metabolite transporter (DMT)-like permease